MKTINFKEVTLFTNIEKTECVVQDVHRDFADMIYNNCTGIEAHALALKIYKAENSAEYEDRELFLIKAFTKKFCTPSFIDAIDLLIPDEDMESRRS